MNKNIRNDNYDFHQVIQDADNLRINRCRILNKKKIDPEKIFENIIPDNIYENDLTSKAAIKLSAFNYLKYRSMNHSNGNLT